MFEPNEDYNEEVIQIVIHQNNESFEEIESRAHWNPCKLLKKGLLFTLLCGGFIFAAFMTFTASFIGNYEASSNSRELQSEYLDHESDALMRINEIKKADDDAERENASFLDVINALISCLNAKKEYPARNPRVRKRAQLNIDGWKEHIDTLKKRMVLDSKNFIAKTRIFLNEHGVDKQNLEELHGAITKVKHDYASLMAILPRKSADDRGFLDYCQRTHTKIQQLEDDLGAAITRKQDYHYHVHEALMSVEKIEKADAAGNVANFLDVINALMSCLKAKQEWPGKEVTRTIADWQKYIAALKHRMKLDSEIFIRQSQETAKKDFDQALGDIQKVKFYYEILIGMLPRFDGDQDFIEYCRSTHITIQQLEHHLMTKESKWIMSK